MDALLDAAIVSGASAPDAVKLRDIESTSGLTR
jgi:hypothetical protein